MDCVNKMKPDRALSLADRKRAAALIMFGALVMAVIAIKSFNDGWFEPRPPLPLDGKPALILFMLGRGCECQMSVVHSAEAQLAAWIVPDETDVPMLRVDFSRQPDLAQQYGVARAPALVLLDSHGQVICRKT